MTDLENTEEIDYMSEEFLTQCTGTKDIRPGLTSSYSVKRKYKMEREKREKDLQCKKVKTSELRENRLQKGLSTAINSSNKGFAMLQKMGYKPGMSLGKEGKGRLEPIAVQLKCDRNGLGWQQIILRKRELQKIRREKQRQADIDPDEYRARQSSKHHQKQIEGDLGKSRKACYNLDQTEDISEPHVSWFWPAYILKQDDDEGDVEDEAETLEPSDQLDVLTSYLRETYLYCIWCGQAYDTQEDLTAECPGNTRSDHE